MKNRIINIGAVNRSLAIHGESVGVVRAGIPVNARNRSRVASLMQQHPVNRVLELFGEELGDDDLVAMGRPVESDSRAQAVGMLDHDFELHPVDRVLELFGEALGDDDLADMSRPVEDDSLLFDHGFDIDAVNRALSIHGEALDESDLLVAASVPVNVRNRARAAEMFDLDPFNRALAFCGEAL